MRCCQGDPLIFLLLTFFLPLPISSHARVGVRLCMTLLTGKVEKNYHKSKQAGSTDSPRHVFEKTIKPKRTKVRTEQYRGKTW
jgi:hypothetical protein